MYCKECDTIPEKDDIHCARDGSELSAQAVPYEPFETLHDVVATLDRLDAELLAAR